jgi:hypothetical protein
MATATGNYLAHPIRDNAENQYMQNPLPPLKAEPGPPVPMKQVPMKQETALARLSRKAHLKIS